MTLALLSCAGFAGGKTAAIARTLHHHGHRFQAHGFEFSHGQFARTLDAFRRDLPGVTVGNDGGIGRGQFIPNVELVGARDPTGAKRTAFGLNE